MKLRLSPVKRRLKKPPLPRNRDGQILVHVGCGTTNSPEFINVDARPPARVHVVTGDIAPVTRFGSWTGDPVYICHVPEHVRKGEFKNILLETKRVVSGLLTDG